MLDNNNFKKLKNIFYILNIKNINNFQKELLKDLLIILIAVLLSVNISKRFIVKSSYKSKQIVSINLTQILKDFTIKLAQSQKQDEEIIIEIQNFTQDIDKLLKDVAETNNLVIIPSQASIAGTKDITNEIKNFLNLKSVNASKNKVKSEVLDEN